MIAAQTQSSGAQQGIQLSGDLVGSAGMAMSPGVAQYGDWTFGRSYGAGSWLPRDPRNFQTGAFGPLSPIRPVTIDRPREEDGDMRPDPRRFQYPVGWNLPIGMPGTEGLKLATFSNLRAYADLYSVARACIQLRKEEMLGLQFDIVPIKDVEQTTAMDREARNDFKERRQKMLDFFERADPNYQSFQSWFSAILEDIFVVDALSLFLHPTRLKGKGLFGSDLGALDLLDGTTIRPLLDIRGATPRPPAVAYQQYLWGVPRRDLMDVIMQQDEDELGEVAAEYRGDQLLYLPYLVRTWTPYGFPPIERSVIPVTTGFRRQQYLLQYYTEGSIPGVFISPGAASGITTPEQIRALQSTMNAIAGDQAFKHKIVVLPPDSKIDEQKKNAFDDHAENTIHEHVLMAFDVLPMELGLLPGGRSSGLGGKGVGEHTEQVMRRRALIPFSNWLKRSLFDYVIHTIWRQMDMEWKWTGIEAEEDVNAKDDTTLQKVQSGRLSIDEARIDDGLQPWGIPASSKPIIVTQKEVMLLEQVGQMIDQATGQQDPAHDPSLSAADHRQQRLNVQQPVDTASDASASTARLQDGRLQEQIRAGGPGPASADAKPAGTPGKAPAGPPPGDGSPGPGVSGGTPDYRASQPAKPGGPVAEGRPKQVLVELHKLQNFLRHGRKADRFASTIITPEFAAQVSRDAKRLGLKRAIREAGRTLTRQWHFRNREKAVNPIMTTAAREMAKHATGAARGTTSLLAFIDESKGVLQQAYLSAYRAGQRQYASDFSTGKNLDWHNPTHPTPRDLAHEEAQTASEQRAQRAMSFLHGFAQDLASGADPAKLAGRINLYVGGVVASYEQGYAQAYFAAHRTVRKDALRARRLADDAEPDDVPSDVTPVSGPTDFVPDPSDGATILVTWNAMGDACPLCAERDGQQFSETDLPGYPGDGDFGELCEGGPNCRCWLSYDGPDSEGSVDGGDPELQTLSAKPSRTKDGPFDVEPTQTEGPAVPTVLADVPELEREPAVDDPSKPKKPRAQKVGDWGAQDLSDPRSPSVLDLWDAETQLASDTSIGQEVFQANVADEQAVAMEDLPQLEQDVSDLVDRANAQDDGSDGGDSQDVDAGQDPADGSGDNPDDVGSDDGSGDTSDDYSAVAKPRRRRGKAANNISTLLAPVAAGIAVRSDETGRVLMLQRALNPDDPASGTWEFPGGHIDPGETAGNAAKREWEEETGVSLPGGIPAGVWTSPDGVYVLFIHRVRSEADVVINLDNPDRVVLNPDDPDGDNVEVVAWFDPATLPSNPALRAELRAFNWSLLA